MNRIILIFVFTYTGFSAQAQTPINAGNVSGTWTKTGSPYQVKGNIKVPAGQKLTITEGVTVEFQGKYKLDVWGVLQVLGKANDTVLFTPKDKAAGWQGVLVHKQPSTNDSTIFKYTKFEYRGGTDYFYVAPKGSVLNIDTCDKIIITNCRFNNNYVYQFGALCLLRSKVNIVNCLFDHNFSQDATTNGASFTSGLAVNYSTGQVLNCKFTANKNLALNATGIQGAYVSSFYGCPNINVFNNKYVENGDTFWKGYNADVALINGTSATIKNCLFRRLNVNPLYSGGLIGDPIFSEYNNKLVTISKCRFLYHGGALNYGNDYFPGTSILLFDSCYFFKTGGFYANGNTGAYVKTIFSNCYISNSLKSKSDAAAMITGRTNATIELRNTIFANCTESIEITDGTLNIYNSLIVNNQRIKNGIVQRDSFATGIHVSDNGKAFIYNSIISGNKSANGTNKSIEFNYDLISPEIHIFNSIVEGGKSSFSNFKNSFLLDYSNVLEKSPSFKNPTSAAGYTFDASNADWHPINTCSTIGMEYNAGVSTIPGYTILKIDMDSLPRIANGKIDIGPYEIQNPKKPLVYAEPRDTAICQNIINNQLFGHTTYADSATYKWEYSYDKVAWSSISGQTTSSLKNYDPISTQTRYIRCIITNPLCPSSDTTKAAKLNVKPKPVPNLGADKSLAQTDSITLNPGTFTTYSWTTGASTSTLKVKKTNLQIGNNTIGVTVTNADGCTATDEITIYLIPGLDAKTLNLNGILVYPNPMQNQLHILLPANIQSATFQINNLAGQLLLNGTAQGTSFVDVSSLSAGTYILTLQAGDRVYGVKVVK